jgi:hypothetical protein
LDVSRAEKGGKKERQTDRDKDGERLFERLAEWRYGTGSKRVEPIEAGRPNRIVPSESSVHVCQGRVTEDVLSIAGHNPQSVLVPLALSS